jgi:hypothetical protein
LKIWCIFIYQDPGAFVKVVYGSNVERGAPVFPALLYIELVLVTRHYFQDAAQIQTSGQMDRSLVFNIQN